MGRNAAAVMDCRRRVLLTPGRVRRRIRHGSLVSVQELRKLGSPYSLAERGTA